MADSWNTSLMSYVGGGAGNDDLKATSNVNGTLINSGAGDDILRGGKFNDILDGGAGNDQMWGGGGADQFRFFANKVDGVDTDKIYDLNFGDGDVMVFGGFDAGTYSDLSGLDGFSGGSSAIVSSWEGLANMVSSTGWTVSQKGATDVAILSYDFGDGRVQEIHVSNGWAALSSYMV